MSVNQALVISRDRRNFTERDRLVLNFIRPHLRQTYANLAAFHHDCTAKKHLEHIYEKFGVQTRLSAVMYALEHLGIFS